MAAKLTALESVATYTPAVYRCACGCGAYASRGFPNGVWYAPEHVPPTLRAPWAAGYVAPAAEAPVLPRAVAPDAPFLPGLSPA